MIIDQKLLDELSAQAKANPRLRQSYDLRTEASNLSNSSNLSNPSHRDSSQRILNAVEPGTVLPIHRHRNSTETIVCLRGKVVQHYYDDKGNKIASYVLAPYPSNPSNSADGERSRTTNPSEPIPCAMSVPVG